MAAEERRASERETPLVAVEQCAAELAGSDEVAEVAREQRSVWWLLVASLLFAAANSWTFGALFDVYLYVLSGGSNSFVGTAETVKGLIGLGTAVPLGYLADKRPRAQVLRVSSLCGLLVAAGSALGMLLENQGLVLLSVGCFAALSQSCSGGSFHTWRGSCPGHGAAGHDDSGRECWRSLCSVDPLLVFRR